MPGLAAGAADAVWSGRHCPLSYLLRIDTVPGAAVRPNGGSGRRGGRAVGTSATVFRLTAPHIRYILRNRKPCRGVG